MNDSFFDKSHEAIADLSQNIDALFFREVRMTIYEPLQVTIAYLLDDIVIMTALHHIQHPHYVLRFDQLQDLDLRKQG